MRWWTPKRILGAAVMTYFAVRVVEANIKAKYGVLVADSVAKKSITFGFNAQCFIPNFSIFIYNSDALITIILILSVAFAAIAQTASNWKVGLWSPRGIVNRLGMWAAIITALWAWVNYLKGVVF